MIGIIGAMDSEVNSLFSKMSAKEKIQYNNLVFYKGKLLEKDVVIVKCGIGKVNAALCTQLLILKFKVSAVINTGIAGATGDGLKIYDFVVSSEVVYHDFDTVFFRALPPLFCEYRAGDAGDGCSAERKARPGKRRFSGEFHQLFSLLLFLGDMLCDKLIFLHKAPSAVLY